MSVSPEHPIAGPDQQIRVVLADDTEDVRLLLRIALSRDGRFKVVGEATNGLEAIAAVSEARPHVVLLDLAMPVMDGMQAIPEIRSVAPETAIVVLSGFERSGIEDEALRLGARAYIEKGAPLDEMMDALEGIVGGASLAAVPYTAPARPDGLHDLLAMLGHELSSPVAVIEGFATLIQRESERLSRQEIADFADAIARGGKQLQAIVNSFYDARHLASGEFVVDPEPVALGALIRQTLADLTPTVAPHPITTDGDIARTVNVDPVRIRQVLEGLVGNAAKFSRGSLPVHVSVRDTGSSIELAVTDHCGGIAEQDTSLLFQRFSKIRKGGPGLGLGLYIARGIATAHHGDLTMEPTSDGCTFRLTLPA